MKKVVYATQQLDQPNVILPLAASYDTRGIQGQVNVLTNALDQRKVNSCYQPVKNSMSGKATLKLVKRPGCAPQANNYSFGATGQVPYLLVGPPPLAAVVDIPWVFSTSSNTDVRASSNLSTTVIESALGSFPQFADRTAISGTTNIVLQTHDATQFGMKAYYASTISAWAQISSSTFTGLSTRGKMEHMDGYAFILDNMNRIYNSDLNSLANWTAGSYLTKQIQQDSPIGLARLSNQIIGFGSETTEVYQNAGNPVGTPLVTRKELFARVGLQQLNTAGQTHYYATLNGKLYFIGRRAGGGASVGLMVYNGQSFDKVSTPFIDKLLNDGRIYAVNTVGFHGQAAIALSMDPPTTTTAQRWLMFFPDWNDWFEWNSTVFFPANHAHYFLGLNGTGQKVYTLASASDDFNSADNWQDNGSTYTFIHQFKLPRNGNQKKYMNMFGVQGDTARSTQSLNVQFSDDDGQTWSSSRAIDMTQVAKKHIYRCGAYTERHVRLSYTGALDVNLEEAVASVR